MYQPNQAPYNPYQNPYNPQNPNDPNPYNSPNQFNNNPYGSLCEIQSQLQPLRVVPSATQPVNQTNSKKANTTTVGRDPDLRKTLALGLSERSILS